MKDQAIEAVRDFISQLWQQNPHWLVPVIVGAVISLLMPILLRVLVYPIRRLRRHWIEGPWYHYFYNFDPNQPTLKSEKWSIRKGIRHRFVIHTESTIAEEPRYSGHLYFEKDFVITRLSASGGHEEEVFERYQIRLPSRADLYLVGISIAQDYAGHASAGANILSRKELTEAEIQDILSNRMVQSSTGRVMKVKKG